jgi:hypothetical protein
MGKERGSCKCPENGLGVIGDRVACGVGNDETSRTIIAVELTINIPAEE